MDFHDKSALIKHYPIVLQKLVYELNCGQRSLKDGVRERRPKTAVVSENIDAVRELIMKH